MDEAASIDVLCADKTGTLTQNALTVTAVHAMSGFDEAHILGLASLASSDGGQDPVDTAVRSAAAGTSGRRSSQTKPIRALRFRHEDVRGHGVRLERRDRANCEGRVCRGRRHRATGARGFYDRETTGGAGVSGAGSRSGSAKRHETRGNHRSQRSASNGFGVVDCGTAHIRRPDRYDHRRCAGDREDRGSRDRSRWSDLSTRTHPPDVRPEEFAVFAGVLPEGKYNLVKAFQKSGHIVGMCGDGANDAPALRQAQMGIAVSTATDVAKSAAGIVLTKPGLEGIVASVKEGRVTFQRILTYTLNSVTNKVVKTLFLAVGLIMTGHAILTPLLIIISMLGGDLLGMSLTTDNVQPSSKPNRWRIGKLTVAGIFMGISELIFCSAVLAAGKFRLGFGIEALRTVSFLAIVFVSQAGTYTNRERRRLGASRPSRMLVVSSAVDVAIASALAAFGIAMTPLPSLAVGGILFAAAVFTFVMDFAKIPVFSRLRIELGRNRIDQRRSYDGGASLARTNIGTLGLASLCFAAWRATCY